MYRVQPVHKAVTWSPCCTMQSCMHARARVAWVHHPDAPLRHVLAVYTPGYTKAVRHRGTGGHQGGKHGCQWDLHASHSCSASDPSHGSPHAPPPHKRQQHPQGHPVTSRAGSVHAGHCRGTGAAAAPSTYMQGTHGLQARGATDALVVRRPLVKAHAYRHVISESRLWLATHLRSGSAARSAQRAAVPGHRAAAARGGARHRAHMRPALAKARLRRAPRSIWSERGRHSRRSSAAHAGGGGAL